MLYAILDYNPRTPWLLVKAVYDETWPSCTCPEDKLARQGRAGAGRPAAAHTAATTTAQGPRGAGDRRALRPRPQGAAAGLYIIDLRRARFANETAKELARPSGTGSSEYRPVAELHAHQLAEQKKPAA